MIKLSRLKLAELEDKFSILSKEEQEALFGEGKTYILFSAQRYKL